MSVVELGRKHKAIKINECRFALYRSAYAHYMVNVHTVYAI